MLIRVFKCNETAVINGSPVTFQNNRMIILGPTLLSRHGRQTAIVASVDRPIFQQLKRDEEFEIDTTKIKFFGGRTYSFDSSVTLIPGKLLAAPGGQDSPIARLYCRILTAASLDKPSEPCTVQFVSEDHDAEALNLSPDQKPVLMKVLNDATQGFYYRALSACLPLLDRGNATSVTLS